MASRQYTLLTRIATFVSVLVVLRVTAAVVYRYVDYLPPNFQSEFLSGRESYFFGVYRWAFYVHLVSGPLSLVLGLLLISRTFRSRWPAWHRRLGRVQAVNILALVVPSGLWMSMEPMAGAIAGWGFAMQAILTGVTCACGWSAAVRRRFANHERWMTRCFVLLCGAVFLRIACGTATVLGITSEWFDPAVSWGCWLVPLGLYEVAAYWNRMTGERVAAAHSST